MNGIKLAQQDNYKCNSAIINNYKHVVKFVLAHRQHILHVRFFG